MKKIIFSMLVVFMASHAAFSQYGPIGGITSGANTGKQKRTSDFQYNDYPTNLDDKSKIDFLGGLRAGYSFGRFALLTDISYERNTHFTETVDTYLAYDQDSVQHTGIWRTEERLSRISFPVLARFTVLGSEDGGLTLSAGPSFSIGLKGKRSNIFDTGAETFPLAPTESISMGKSRFDEYRGFEAGLMLGIGGVIPLMGGGEDGQLRLTFDLRKKWSFSDMYTQARKNYLSVVDGTEILGSKFLRGTYLSVGLEYILSTNKR